MPYRRKRTYYVDICPAGYPGRIGPLSTRSTNKNVARQMEATVRELAALGRHKVLEALRERRITLPELHTAKVTGRLEDVARRAIDRPLDEAIRDFLEAHPDPRYQTAMDRLQAVAPRQARVSWLALPENMQTVVRHYRQEGLSPATERREMAGVSFLLKELFGSARRRDIMQDVQVRSPGKGRTRWLSETEITALRKHSGDLWPLIATAIGTGMRRGELLAMRVRDLDIDRGMIVIPQGKSARARRSVPLGGEVLDLLRLWVESRSLGEEDLVFGTITAEALRPAWEDARRAAGLEDVWFHDLRHTYAVHCAKAGMPLGELQQRLGHASITMTMRYAVYQSPTASIHYSQALCDMGLAAARGPKIASPTSPKPLTL